MTSGARLHHTGFLENFKLLTLLHRVYHSSVQLEEYKCRQSQLRHLEVMSWRRPDAFVLVSFLFYGVRAILLACHVSGLVRRVSLLHEYFSFVSVSNGRNTFHKFSYVLENARCYFGNKTRINVSRRKHVKIYSEQKHEL